MANNYKYIKPVSPFLFMLVASCACALVYLAALPYKINLLMEISNRTLLVLWILGGGYVLLRRLMKSAHRVVTCTVLLLVSSFLALLVSVSQHPSDIFDKLMKVFGFLALPLMLFYSALFNVDERAKRAVCYFALLCSVLFISLYNSDLRYFYDNSYGGVEIADITLGYANPNQTAIYLFSCVVILFAARSYFKSSLIKWLFTLDGCYMAWILYQTNSRTAILMLGMFAILALVLRKRSIPRWLVNFALLVPLLYVGLFLVLSFLQQHIAILDADIFNGRDRIYGTYFDALSIRTILFGDMNTFEFDNLHNGYVAVAASLGMVACLCYGFCLKSCATGNRPGKDTPGYARAAYIAFLCMIMYTASEAAFFVGGSVYGFLLFTPVVLFATPYARKTINAEEP